MVAQLDELAEKIALLEQKADKERADEDTLRDLQDQYANLETRRYRSSAEDIAYYQEMAKSLYVSEGSPLTYDDALQVLVQRYLNGAFDAATFNGGVKFKIFDDYPAISMALDAGDVDAFCVDKSILANYKTDGRSFIEDSFSPQEYGVATKKGSELSGKIEALITEWLADGTIDGMIKEWGLE